MINFYKQRLLIISPHPDDEVIGCAGLIQKIKENNGQVFVLFLTVANTKDFSKTNYSTSSARKKEIESVIAFLQIDKYEVALEGEEFHLKLDILGQKRLMDIIERESKLSIEKIRPTIVALPTFTSYNQDHRIAALATHASLRPSEIKMKHFVQTVLEYEEPADLWNSGQLMLPNMFIELSKKEMKKKLSAMLLYKSQVRKYPNLRSIKALELHAAMRGISAGTRFAEAYKILRLSTKP